MPMSRLPRSDWLGSSTSQFLITRSNLSFGPIAATAGALLAAASASEPALPRKSRRDRTDIASSLWYRCWPGYNEGYDEEAHEAMSHSLDRTSFCREPCACRRGQRVGRISRTADPGDR